MSTGRPIIMKLDINEEFYDRLAQRADQKGFDSAEEYSTVVLETVIDEIEDDSPSEEITTRLQDLGYLE